MAKFQYREQKTAGRETIARVKEKYKSLVESSTEGIMLLLNGEISYANSFIQNWLQYTSQELLEIKPEICLRG
jgi:PAS domain-containing protein